MYREFHDISKSNHTVRYEDSNSNLIASKEINYDKGFISPLYKMHDYRHKRITGCEWENGHFRVFRQEENNELKQKILKPSNDMVIDAGFDYFIRSHWNELTHGKQLPFSFVVTDPLLVLNMKIDEVRKEESVIHEKNTDFRYFFVRSRNQFIGWAIPDIHLAYSNKDQLLQIYQGPSNLTSNNDHSQSVVIRYEYPKKPNTLNGDVNHE